MKQKRILVVRTDRVGDVAVSTPLIRGLRRAFPDAYIGALVRSYSRSLLENNPHLDVIITDDFEQADAGRAGFWRKTQEIRSHKFNTALMLLPTERAAWMLMMAGIRRRIGVGHKLYQVLTFTGSVSRHKYIPLRHEADYCLDLGRAIGVSHDDLSPEVFLTAQEIAWAEEFLRLRGLRTDRPIVCIHPGSGNSAPNWPISAYAQLARLLQERAHLQMITAGSAGEKKLAADLATLAPTLYDFSGELNLRQLMAVLSRCRLLISSSTGPMHIAAALKIGTVSLFCHINVRSPQLWGPIGNPQRIIMPEVNDCCTGIKHGSCRVQEIPVERVYQAVMDLLSETR